ncbi:uncharacterized protein EURHEDRAFT_410673, partial [Aspergillus ruber CBS 135680]
LVASMVLFAVLMMFADEGAGLSRYNEPTPVPQKRIPQRCGGCGTIGHTIRNSLS